MERSGLARIGMRLMSLDRFAKIDDKQAVIVNPMPNRLKTTAGTA
jgi:hypothetical protein